MDMNELNKEQLDADIGSEVVNDFVQNIPGAAPTFDTLTEEELTENRIVPKIKKHAPDPDAYKATSASSNSNDN